MNLKQGDCELWQQKKYHLLVQYVAQEITRQIVMPITVLSV